MKSPCDLFLSKNHPNALVSGIIKETGALYVEQWRKDGRAEMVTADNPLLRKIEKIKDCEWLYERLSPYYRHNSGRPENDPVALIRMVLLQHPFGIPFLRKPIGKFR